MFVIPGTNIGGGAGSFLSRLALLSVSACRRASNLLVIVIGLGWLFVSCSLFFFIVGTFVVLWHVLFLPLPLTACQDSRSSLSSLSVLSSASEKSAVWVGALLVVAAWDVWIR
jgi:hypothetical protein